MKAVKYDLKGVKTAEEALDIPDLSWEAQPVGLVTENGVALTENRAIQRSDNNKVIGVVGTRYVPLQNSFAFSFFDTICQQHNAKYDNAYVIDGGSRVILEATINGPVTIRKGDEVLRKIKLINTFDGSMPFTAVFTVWRMICKNGLMGLTNENKCRITHTKNGENRSNEALRLLATSMEFFNKFEQQCKVLAQKILDKKMVDSFLKQCNLEEKSTRQKNLRDKVIELYEAGTGTGQGTGWDMYNAYVEWIDHFRSADDDTRLANAVIGSASMKEHAFSIVSAL
jgi:phage/plasmid-like protein (TIGR03299 family)